MRMLNAQAWSRGPCNPMDNADFQQRETAQGGELTQASRLSYGGGSSQALRPPQQFNQFCFFARPLPGQWD